MQAQRNKRKILIGTVISDKMDKTIVVSVSRLSKHPAYGKILKHQSKFKVHDEENKAKVGDKVKIAETRPISKEKYFRLIEIMK